MISSPSAQIVNALSEHMNVTGAGGKQVPAYGPVMGVATAIIAAGIVCTTMVGPEKRGRHFELAKVAGAGVEPVKDVESAELEEVETREQKTRDEKTKEIPA
jgi:hypothetical protein